MVMSLGLFASGIGTIDQQSGTMMHEIGHLVCLNHGGTATNVQGCKPNYVSVMSYSRQFNNFVADRDIDFSRENMGDLDETGATSMLELNAFTGLTESIGEQIVWFDLGSSTPILQTITANMDVDWDQDSTLEAGVFANVNKFGIASCKGEIGSV